MITLAVITVVQDGMAAVMLPGRNVQTPLLKRIDGGSFAEGDLGKQAVVAFWSDNYTDGVILGVLV
jgi:hypothetical protein